MQPTMAKLLTVIAATLLTVTAFASAAAFLPLLVRVVRDLEVERLSRFLGARHERDAALALLPGWSLRTDGAAISRTFAFADFSAAFGFMARVALAAERQGHHPDWSNVYRTVRVALHTHDAGGLTALDLELARAMNLGQNCGSLVEYLKAFDVTLRVSGFFRDAFPAQIELVDDACRAVAGLDDAESFTKLLLGYTRLQDILTGRLLGYVSLRGQQAQLAQQAQQHRVQVVAGLVVQRGERTGVTGADPLQQAAHPRLEVVRVDVLDAGAVAVEVQGAPVGGPLRRHVDGAVVRDLLDGARRELDDAGR